MHVLMLPGLDGTGALFQQFSSALPSSLVPIICTYPPDASLGYIDLQEIARKLVPKDEPYIIVGESFSGPVAIRLASSGGLLEAFLPHNIQPANWLAA